MILYLRAVAYFCLRYFLKLGFLDGRAGWRSVSQARLSPRYARPSLRSAVTALLGKGCGIGG